MKIKHRRLKWNTKVIDEEKFLIQALWIQRRYKEFCWASTSLPS
ncbi:hypothetical protein COO91_05881 [Nostoc flagelliforme CCNUN1]|uniref:Uncharacterized protein n=1 Tax=Nostoc flagelliforme CCNUN1 TaxID=2038116 RepID=A0A2K8SWR6_9NOSO|nr:hypothetical protein COO91_05881 [Nostoc flagelliforme CCNUN1]